MDIKNYIKGIIEEILTEKEFFLVDVEVKPAKSIQIYLDGDNGISISKCAKIGRELINRIDEEELMERNEVIEVSSPGIDHPIVNPRQYNKNIDRYFNLTLVDDTIKEGKLIAIEPEVLTFEEELKEKGKKLEIKEVKIDLDKIKESKVIIKF